MASGEEKVFGQETAIIMNNNKFINYLRIQHFPLLLLLILIILTDYLGNGIKISIEIIIERLLCFIEKYSTVS